MCLSFKMPFGTNLNKRIKDLTCTSVATEKFCFTCIKRITIFHFTVFTRKTSESWHKRRWVSSARRTRSSNFTILTLWNFASTSEENFPTLIKPRHIFYNKENAWHTPNKYVVFIEREWNWSLNLLTQCEICCLNTKLQFFQELRGDTHKGLQLLWVSLFCSTLFIYEGHLYFIFQLSSDYYSYLGLHLGQNVQLESWVSVDTVWGSLRPVLRWGVPSALPPW